MSAKRGSVIKRGKGWVYIVDLPRKKGEKRRQQWVSRDAANRPFRTKRDAQAALTKSLSKLDDGNDPFPDKMVLAEYVDKVWFPSKLRGQKPIRPLTAERYRGLLDRYILNELGHLYLGQIGPRHVQHVIDRMEERGQSPRSIVQARAILHNVLKTAVAREMIMVNPATSIERPSVDKPDLAVPNVEQVKALLLAAEGTMWEVPLVLAAMTGMRRGEVLGARWEDANLPERVLHIKQTLQKVNGEFRFPQPKTEQGKRTVGLKPFVIKKLRNHRTAQNKDRMKMGPGWKDLDLICTRGDGSPIDPNEFTKATKRLCKVAGLAQNTRLHDLRHSAASIFMASDMSVLQVSKELGHAKASFTMDVYGHVLDEDTSRAATKAMSDAFGEGW